MKVLTNRQTTLLSDEEDQALRDHCTRYSIPASAFIRSAIITALHYNTEAPIFAIHETSIVNRALQLHPTATKGQLDAILFGVNYEIDYNGRLRQEAQELIEEQIAWGIKSEEIVRTAGEEVDNPLPTE